MSLENAKNFFIDKLDKAIEKSNHERHIELIEKHINFTKTSDGLNSSIRCFLEHGKASGTFLQQLKKYAEEYAEQYKYDFSKSCECGSSRIGETWCCNQCGLPVSTKAE